MILIASFGHNGLVRPVSERISAGLSSSFLQLQCNDKKIPSIEILGAVANRLAGYVVWNKVGAAELLIAFAKVGVYLSTIGGPIPCVREDGVGGDKLLQPQHAV